MLHDVLAGPDGTAITHADRAAAPVEVQLAHARQFRAMPDLGDALPAHVSQQGLPVLISTTHAHLAIHIDHERRPQADTRNSIVLILRSPLARDYILRDPPVVASRDDDLVVGPKPCRPMADEGLGFRVVLPELRHRHPHSPRGIDALLQSDELARIAIHGFKA